MAPSCCTACDVKVTRASKALHCQGCEQWTHARCTGVPDKLYDLLLELEIPNLPYICKLCLPMVSSVRTLPASQMTSETARKIQQNASHGTPEIDILDAPVSASTPDHSPEASLVDPNEKTDTTVIETTKPQNKTYAEAIQTQVAVKQKPLRRAKRNPNAPLPVQDLTNRVQQLEKIVRASLSEPPTTLNKPTAYQGPNRNRCIIVMKATESTKDNPAARMLDDQAFLQNMVSTLFDNGEDGINVLCAYRLGKKADDPLTNPRPMKVVLKSEEEARRVFSRSHRLRGCSYRILRDLSPEDRIKMRNAVHELKERKERGENNLHIVDFQVVVRRPRVAWHPVTIQPRADVPQL